MIIVYYIVAGGHLRQVFLSQVLTCWVLLLVTVMMLKSVHVNSMTSNITVDLYMWVFSYG